MFEQVNERNKKSLAYGYYLIRVVHHGNEHVYQNDNHYATINAEHQQADKHRECVLAVQRVQAVFLNQAERSPVQCLHCFEKALK